MADKFCIVIKSQKVKIIIKIENVYLLEENRCILLEPRWKRKKN